MVQMLHNAHMFHWDGQPSTQHNNSNVDDKTSYNHHNVMLFYVYTVAFRVNTLYYDVLEFTHATAVHTKYYSK